MGWPCTRAGQAELTSLTSDLELRRMVCWKAYFFSSFGQPFWVPLNPLLLTQPLSHLSVGENYRPRPKKGILLPNDHRQGCNPTQGPTTASPLIHKLSVYLWAEPVREQLTAPLLI